MGRLFETLHSAFPAQGLPSAQGSWQRLLIQAVLGEHSES